MGTILAMNAQSIWPLLAAGFLVLSGCGTEQQSPLVQVAKSLPSIFQSGGESAPQRPDDLLTRAEIEQVTVPYGIVGIDSRGAFATMTLVGQSRGYKTWVTGDGAGFVLRGDLLTGTKGLGPDLYSADIGTLAQAIAQGGGTSTRVHRYSDGEGRLFSARFDCTLAAQGAEAITIIGRIHQTRVLTETCVSNQETFENRYWIGAGDDVMWQSRQWVGTDLGYVTLLTLVPVAR
jgi:hypothetical protein